jgi:hypothetical protein
MGLKINGCMFSCFTYMTMEVLTLTFIDAFLLPASAEVIAAEGATSTEKKRRSLSRPEATPPAPEDRVQQQPEAMETEEGISLALELHLPGRFWNLTELSTKQDSMPSCWSCRKTSCPAGLDRIMRQEEQKK